jgi:mannose-6-phosphate isomerase-like protein (cupin superfamily)
MELRSTFIVLSGSRSAMPVAVTPALYAELNRRFKGFKGRSLVAVHGFAANWPTWERHPAGDEVVCLLSGRARLLLHRKGGDKVVRLHKPGSFVIVPKGVWHTARIAAPTRMLFITPGAGTQNVSIAEFRKRFSR